MIQIENLSACTLPPPLFRSGRRLGEIEPLLIEVPQIYLRVHRSQRPGHMTFGRRTWTGKSPRPRRRLKREVRLAARVVLGALCLAFILSCGAVARSGQRPVRLLLSMPALPRLSVGSPHADDRSEVWPPARPTVLLSIEPAGSAVESDEDSPVVLPGYLLPDDLREEPAHEGS
jgi:hypothetical protein